MTEEKKDIHEAGVVLEEKTETIKKEVAAEAVNSNSQMRYSGFWVRGAAFIIDSFIVMALIMAVAMPVGIMISLATMFSNSMATSMFGQIFNTFLGLAIGWGYYIFMTNKYQATLGKMAVGTKVVGEDGKELELNKLAIRETIGKFASGLIFGIGYLMAAFTGKKQALHDLIARSVVVYKDPEKGPNRPVVAAVYVVYGLIMIAIMTLVVTLFIIVGMFGFAAYKGASEINEVPYSLEDPSGYIENIEDVESLEQLMEQLEGVSDVTEDLEVNQL